MVCGLFNFPNFLINEIVINNVQIPVNTKNQNFNKHEILYFFSLFWAVDFVKDTQVENQKFKETKQTGIRTGLLWRDDWPVYTLSYT